MGLSTLPTPSDGGVLCVILVNTVISLNIVKGVLRSLLEAMGIHLPPSEIDPYYEPFTGETYQTYQQSDECRRSRSTHDTYIEEFRAQNPSTQFESACKSPGQECSVCLMEFRPSCEIHSLACGHMFHTSCLDKWLDYWNTTCPNCRTTLMQEEDGSLCYY